MFHAHPPVIQSPTAFLELIAPQLQDVNNTTVDEQDEKDAAAVSRLARFASSFLSPLPTSRESAGDKSRMHYCRVSMTALDRLTSSSGALLDDDVLLTIVPYNDPASASSTDVLAASASKILARQFSQRSRSDFIVSVVLETAIRPHLSKWSSARLTATGRVAAYEDSSTGNIPTDLEARPPWVDEGASMIPLFQWALNESDVSQHLPSNTAGVSLPVI